MVSVTVDVSMTGLDLGNLGPKVENALRKELKYQLSEVQLEARKTHRYQTHTSMLEKSVTMEVQENGLVGEVGLDESIAYYGPFVHDGQRSWAPDKFLDEALDKREPYIMEGVEQAINEALS